MGQPAARVSDMHICPMFDGLKPHVGGPILPPGKVTVLIGGMPAATVTDRCMCASAPDVIVQGAQTVLINGLMAARMGDATAHGGRIIIGCPTVLIGGPTGSTPSFFAKFLNVFLDNLKFNAGFIVGFGEGLLSTLKGLYDVLTHPIETIKGIFQLADSVISTLAKKETWIALTEKETWVKIKVGIEKIYNDYESSSPYEKGKVIGRATEFIAELLVPVAKAKLAAGAAETGKVAEITKAAAGIVDVAKPVNQGLTASEIVRLERRKQVLAFYKKHNPEAKPSELHSQIIGVDLDDAIEVTTIPAGTKFHQYVKVGADGKVYPGEYYALDKNSLPTELGISPEYNVRRADRSYTDEVRPLILQEVEILEPIEVLKSKAKGIDDTWSLKPNSPDNHNRVPTRGGAQQVYIPSKGKTIKTKRYLYNEQ